MKCRCFSFFFFFFFFLFDVQVSIVLSVVVPAKEEPHHPYSSLVHPQINPVTVTSVMALSLPLPRFAPPGRAPRREVDYTVQVGARLVFG